MTSTAIVARIALLALAAAWQVAAECPSTTFDTLSPSVTMESVPNQVEWLVSPSKTRLFAKSEGGSVYMSNTQGASWIDETPNLQGSSASSTGDKDSKDVLTIIHQDNSEYMILQGYGANSWATKDMGDTWIQPCGLPGAPPDLCFSSPVADAPGATLSSLYNIHPTLPDHVLVMTMRASCVDRDASTDDSCGQDLMYSSDFGHSWLNLTEESDARIAGFKDFEWAPLVEGEMDDGKPGILATVYEDVKEMVAGVGKYWDYNVHFVYSTDLFQSPHDRRLRCGNAFEVLNGDVYVAQLRDCEAYHDAQGGADSKTKFTGKDITLQTSTDGGRTFKMACFPVGMSQKGYTIFDFNKEDKGPDFISVDHDEEDLAEAAAPMGNLYSSDDSLQLFSLSMRRNVRFDGGAVDFAKVEGIEGVYIANQISGGTFADPSFIAKTKSVDDFVHTRITYNGGGMWEPLKAPLVDKDGKQIECHSGSRCDLHLHGSTHWQRGTWKSRLGSVYTQATAPGIILATGNVGEFLTNDAQRVNTYISRDAGASWEEILKGPHIYEFGNHGGLIVVAKMAALGPTDEVLFSRDEGQCWEGPIRLARPLSVHNIRVDPDATGDVFIIHGTDSQSTDGDPDGVIYTIDFTRLNEKDENQKVTAWTFPTCEPGKDYEWWVPSPPGAPGACILGRNYTMQRRRRDSRCLNKADFERTETKETPCTCDAQYDTECQFGSERKNDFGECVRMNDVDLTSCPALVGKVLPTSNKRILAGSKCVDSNGALGGGSFTVGDDGGGGKKKKGGSGLLTFFLVVLFLGGFGVGGYWAFHRFDLQRFVPEEVSMAVRAMKEKIEELTGRKSPTPAGYFEPLGDFGGEDI